MSGHRRNRTLVEVAWHAVGSGELAWVLSGSCQGQDGRETRGGVRDPEHRHCGSWDVTPLTSIEVGITGRSSLMCHESERISDCSNGKAHPSHHIQSTALASLVQTTHLIAKANPYRLPTCGEAHKRCLVGSRIQESPVKVQDGKC